MCPKRPEQLSAKQLVSSSSMLQHGEPTVMTFYVIPSSHPHSSANNFALKGKRKTLSASDVLSALEDMEFEHFVPELKECLEGEPLFLLVYT